MTCQGLVYAFDLPYSSESCTQAIESYGLPGRQFIDQIFLIMAVSRGLTGAIINPLDKRMMANIIAVEVLIGRYCRHYMKAFRAKKFEL